jgi:hypothetical protein
MCRKEEEIIYNVEKTTPSSHHPLSPSEVLNFVFRVELDGKEGRQWNGTWAFGREKTHGVK